MGDNASQYLPEKFSNQISELLQGDKGVFGNCRPVNTFEKLGRIGQGAYGTVYEAIDKQTKKRVALKRVILHNEKQDGFPLTSLREVALLKRISHPNCVTLLDVAVGRNRDGVFLVFEYCEHDLAHLLETIKRPFSTSEVKTVMQQLLRAVAYLHDNWIIHRDLKMSNLLYNNRGQLKLADFGLARTYGYPQRPMTPTVVTLWYRAPELLLGCEAYSTAIDTWAAGCILGELVRGQPLLPGNTPIDQLALTCALLGTPTTRIWPGLEALPAIRKGTMILPNGNQYNYLPTKLSELSTVGISLVDGLLTYDPSKRLTAHAALNHSFFLEHPFPKEEKLMPTFPAVRASQSPMGCRMNEWDGDLKQKEVTTGIAKRKRR